MLYMSDQSLIRKIRIMIDEFFVTDLFHKRPAYYSRISFPIRIHHHFESCPTEGGFVKNYVIPFYVDYGEGFTSDSFHVRISRDCRSSVSDPEISVDCCLGKQELCDELKDYILRHLPIKKRDPEECLCVIAPRRCGKTMAQAELLLEECLAGKHVAFIGRHYTDTDMYKKCMEYCKADLDICSQYPKHIQTDQDLDDTGVLINRIEKVIFNNPATIVFWKDGTKTTVTAKDEPFDEEKGLAMAIAKKALGNNYAAGGRFKAIMKHAERFK